MTLVGTVLQGKLDAYEIEEVFVSGRFGQTFLARRVSDKEDVIVKTIRLDQESDWSTTDTFERENERLRKLNHPHIAAYLDAVVWRGEDETLLGLVQSYVTTPSLRRWRDGRGLVDLDRCLDWFEKVLEALVYMHELSPPVVHGDLDSGNILISDRHTIQIVDFATVRQALLKPSTLASGMAVGSLDYAPMEQLLGKIFPSSDLYALAMTFLSVLSKLEPREFPVQGMRPALNDILPYDTPEALRELLLQMTEPDPQHRLGSARIALERLRTGRLDGTGRAPDLEPDEASGVGRARPAPVVLSDIDARQQLLHQLERRVAPIYAEHPTLKAWKMDFMPDQERVHAFGIARDGVTMVVAHNHDAHVLDTSTLKPKGDVEFSELARRIAVSRDGKRVAILTGFEDLLFYEVNVSLWKVHEIRVEGMWPGNSQLTFSPDGSRVVISDDDQVNLYAWSSGEQLGKWEVDGQFSLDFAPDGELIFASGVTHTSMLSLYAEPHTHKAQAFAFSPDGTMLAIVQGNTVTFGHMSALEPEVRWAHDDITIKLPDFLKDRRVHILRFSPDQRVLFAGCAEGGWVLIDTQAQVMLDVHDHRRSEDIEHVKIFEVGFSADSSRLLLHGTLRPDEFGHDRLGTVLCWKIPTGRFLGSLLWLDDELSIMTSHGFHGEISEAHSRGFSSNQWERPDVASVLFAGRDTGELLTSKERASMTEFTLRYKAMVEVEQLVDVSFNALTAANHLTGLSHVASLAFERADVRYEDSNQRADSLNHGDYLASLADAAFQLDVDHDDEEMLALHQDLLKVPEIKAPVTASAPSNKEAMSESRHEETYQEPSRATASPARSSSSKRDSEIDDGEREPGARRGLSAPLSDIHRNHDHSKDQATPVHAKGSGGNVLVRLVVATVLGFGVTGLFVVFAMHDNPDDMRLMVLVGVGLLLTLTFHFGMLRQIMKG